MTIEQRVWIRSGVVEELDERQQRLMRLVFEKIKFYYARLCRTRPCYRHPLSLSRLMNLSNRSSTAVMTAIRYLAHTIPVGSEMEPPIYAADLPEIKRIGPTAFFCGGKA